MSTPLRTGSAQPGLLTLNIRDKNSLYLSYMSFIKNGGLFIPTTREYRLDDEVIILLTLMDDPERLSVTGKIVWITPQGAQGKRMQGIGVQFSAQNGGVVQKKIETHLVGLLSTNGPTHTL